MRQDFLAAQQKYTGYSIVQCSIPVYNRRITGGSYDTTNTTVTHCSKCRKRYDEILRSKLVEA
jgi:hypothetical protein